MADKRCHGARTALQVATLRDVAGESRVTVYTTQPCGFCAQAKALLRARGIAFDEVNLAKDPHGRAELVATTGQMTFPQILVGRRSIGGFRELLEADRDGSLPRLLVG
jgi:glutaredoxin 3